MVGAGSAHRRLDEDRVVVAIEKVGPFRIAVEFPASGDEPGYGFVLGTEGMGMDGDSLDAWIGNDPESPVVHVVHLPSEIDANGYGEAKLLIGFPQNPDDVVLPESLAERRPFAFETFPADELAEALRQAPEGRPIIPASAVLWTKRLSSMRFPGGRTPRPLLLVPVTDRDEPTPASPANRWPWHAMFRTGNFTGQPESSGAELHGHADQSSPPASTGWRTVTEDRRHERDDSPPDEPEGLPFVKTADDVAMARAAGIASWGQLTADPERVDPLRQNERDRGIHDVEPKIDTITAGSSREAVRAQLADVAAMVADAIGADGRLPPGRAWIDALRWMRENPGVIYLKTGFTPTAAEQRMIARLIMDAVRESGDAASALRAAANVGDMARYGADMGAVVAEAVHAGVSPRLLRRLAEAMASASSVDGDSWHVTEDCGCAHEDETGDDIELQEVAPPGCEHVVKALKREGDVENPYAIAWAMYNRGECGRKKRKGSKKEKRKK